MRRFAIAALFLAGSATGGTIEAATLYVRTEGTDVATCTDDDPCRSLKRAIALASAGDRIVVGPGRYGDLDLDATFNEAGEEAGPSPGVTAGVITVDKLLSIESRDGAGATILDATGAVNADVVHIAADRVVFGRPGKGFTLTGASSGRCGVLVRNGVSNASVGGNIAVGNGFCGFGHFGESVSFLSNKAIANGQFGFWLLGKARLIGNLATLNLGDGVTSGDGFYLSAFDEGVVMQKNVAVGNGRDGFHSSSTSDGSTLTVNSFIGNARFGVIVLSGHAVIQRNNIYGNGTKAGTGFPNCGLRHLGTGSITSVYFGDPNGPGADPADTACGTVPVTSFSTLEIAVPDVLQ